MNLGTMQTALQRYGFDTTDPLSVWLNAAMHDMETANDWPWEEELTTVNVNAGANTILFPNDLRKVMLLKDNTNLAQLTYWERHKWIRMIQDETDSGLPEVYTLVGTNQIQIWRVPYTPITFQILYQATTPDLVSSTDVPTTGTTAWPVETHYPIVVHAAEMALMAESEEERAKSAQSQYNDMLLRLMGKFNRRELGDAESVQDTQGYLEDMPIRGVIGG